MAFLAAVGVAFGATAGTATAVAVGGAVTGAVVGGITAAVKGDNIVKGALIGGALGGVGAGIGAVASPATFGLAGAGAAEAAGTIGMTVGEPALAGSGMMSVGQPALSTAPVTGMTVGAPAIGTAATGMAAAPTSAMDMLKTQAKWQAASGALQAGAGYIQEQERAEETREQMADMERRRKITPVRRSVPSLSGVRPASGMMGAPSVTAQQTVDMMKEAYKQPRGV